MSTYQGPSPIKLVTLTRSEFLSYGIFGKLEDDSNLFKLFTLEHAYPVTPNPADSFSTNYASKIPVGVYLCVRGMHKLEHSAGPFETFEITGVTGHTGLLFHVGNWQSDVEGCVALGLSRFGDEVVHSTDAFKIFMNSLEGISQFNLEVK